MTNSNLSKGSAIVILLLSGVISWLIANVGINYHTLEPGTLMNLLAPPLVGATTLLFFLLIDWLSPEARSWNTLLMVLINIICVIVIRLESS